MKKLIEKILQAYQKENHIIFRDQDEVRKLIKFAFEYEKDY